MASFSSLILTVMATAVMMMPSLVAAQGAVTDQAEAQKYLDSYNQKFGEEFSKQFERRWAYLTDNTKAHRSGASDAYLKIRLWSQNESSLATRFNTAGFSTRTKRQFAQVKDYGTDALFGQDTRAKLNQVQSNLLNVFNGATVCLSKSFCLRYFRGFADTGAYWRSKYESENFEQDVAALLEELQPLYQQLHAFVRRRLKKQYGEDVFPASGHIPAHLLGNLFAEKWDAIQDKLMPYPDKPLVNVTTQMVQKGYTAHKIYKAAEDFVVSLGLESMPQSFWDKSLFEEPTGGRNASCKPAAFDLLNGVDFRVLQCTKVNLEHLSTAHNLVGRTEYFLLYRNLSVVFRKEALPGFLDAVGETMSLSLETPKHLHQIGLLPSLVEDKQAELNALMSMALKKVVAMPFSYITDKWRWSVFRGDTTTDKYNKAWWDLRRDMQGVSQPVDRTESDFDPGAVDYISKKQDPYIWTFVRNVAQFQFHKALCEAAGHQGPLHTCDIYNSTAAGDKLRAMLSKGTSEKWTVPFQALTGQSKLSVQPLKEYFQPLVAFLKESNKDDKVGWAKSTQGEPNGSAGRLSLLPCLLVLLPVLCL